MIHTIYHGSERRIEKPTFGLGYAANDYGLGFYCTERHKRQKGDLYITQILDEEMKLGDARLR